MENGEVTKGDENCFTLMIWMQLESKMLAPQDIAQLKPGSQKRTELLKRAFIDLVKKMQEMFLYIHKNNTAHQRKSFVIQEPCAMTKMLADFFQNLLLTDHRDQQNSSSRKNHSWKHSTMTTRQLPRLQQQLHQQPLLLQIFNATCT